MEEKLIQILTALYGISDEEIDSFLGLFKKLDTNSQEKLIIALYKRLEGYKKNIGELNKKLDININKIEEIKEKVELDKIELGF